MKPTVALQSDTTSSGPPVRRHAMRIAKSSPSAAACPGHTCAGTGPYLADTVRPLWSVSTHAHPARRTCPSAGWRLHPSVYTIPCNQPTVPQVWTRTCACAVALP
eukprot:2570394-Amphidinium_carterae.3